MNEFKMKQAYARCVIEPETVELFSKYLLRDGKCNVGNMTLSKSSSDAGLASTDISPAFSDADCVMSSINAEPLSKPLMQRQSKNKRNNLRK